jgi:hypothetical protein
VLDELQRPFMAHVVEEATYVNVPNHTNFTKYVGNVQSSFFEQATAALPARRIQFTFRAKF